jgi:UDP-N-acetylmuramoyl-tripeptide--D-alanyl-D-alanine ligase
MTEALWTSAEIVAATGGALAGLAFDVGGVSIDSRSVEPGDLFVAMSGVRDGHDFVPAALAAGAAGAMTLRPMGSSSIVVEDTLKAVERLGEASRVRAPKVRRGAVTGSVGKTSVTQAIRVGLELAGRAHGSVKSYNNHIGVPLTLARMPRATERAIFEIGMNHAGEIRPLARMVQPQAVAITTVGPVHVENFPDGEAGVARSKAEIFEGLQSGGIAVLNADDRWYDFLRDEARRVGAEVRSFGSGEGADARLTGFAATQGGATVRARLNGGDLEFPIRQAGAHWGPNSLCVLLMLGALEVDLETGLAALAAFAPLEGRGAERIVRLAGGAFTLIDESYNANPISMVAALSTLGARSGRGRRIVALTDMLELGEDSRRYHKDLAPAVDAAGADLVFAAGPLMKSLWDALPPTRRGGYAETAAELSPLVVQAIEPGDVVMVKGSLGSKAQAVAAALAALDVGPGERG